MKGKSNEKGKTFDLQVYNNFLTMLRFVRKSCVHLLDVLLLVKINLCGTTFRTKRLCVNVR